MEERRLLLAVAVSLLIITAWGYLFPPPRRTPPSPSPASAPQVSASPQAPASPGPAPSPSPSAGPSRPQVADERERRVEVVSSDVTVAFSTRGARLLSWQLKRFKDHRGRPEEMVMTVPEGPRALDIETADPALDARLRNALFRPRSAEALPDENEITLSVPERREARVSFEYSDGEVQAGKTRPIRGAGYLVQVPASVRQGDRTIASELLWGRGLGMPTAEEMQVQGYQAPQGVVLEPRGVERIPPSKVTESPRRISDAQWV